MKVLWSGIGATDGRGKVGGSVASSNRGGAFFRNRVIGSNPQTTRQQANRGQFSLFSSQWRGLTAGVMAAWNSAASSGDWDFTNNIGRTVRPSGQQLYVKLNMIVAWQGGGFTDPPTPVSLPPAAIDSFLIEFGGGVFGPVTVTMDPSPNSTDFFYEFWCTAGMSQGIWAPPQSLFKKTATMLTNVDPNDFDIANEYNAIFSGDTGGQKVFCDVYIGAAHTGQRIKVGRISSTVAI